FDALLRATPYAGTDDRRQGVVEKGGEPMCLRDHLHLPGVLLGALPFAALIQEEARERQRVKLREGMRQGVREGQRLARFGEGALGIPEKPLRACQVVAAA